MSAHAAPHSGTRRWIRSFGYSIQEPDRPPLSIPSRPGPGDVCEVPEKEPASARIMLALERPEHFGCSEPIRHAQARPERVTKWVPSRRHFKAWAVGILASLAAIMALMGGSKLASVLLLAACWFGVALYLLRQQSLLRDAEAQSPSTARRELPLHYRLRTGGVSGALSLILSGSILLWLWQSQGLHILESQHPATRLLIGAVIGALIGAVLAIAGSWIRLAIYRYRHGLLLREPDAQSTPTAT